MVNLAASRLFRTSTCGRCYRTSRARMRLLFGNVLQCVAVCCNVLQTHDVDGDFWQCVAVCCSVLQCVAVCYRLTTWIGLHFPGFGPRLLHHQYVAVCCSVLQRVAACCSVLLCVVVYRHSRRGWSCSFSDSAGFLRRAQELQRSHVWHNSFIRVTWLTQTCDVTRSYVWAWLIHAWLDLFIWGGFGK